MTEVDRVAPEELVAKGMPLQYSMERSEQYADRLALYAIALEARIERLEVQNERLREVARITKIMQTNIGIAAYDDHGVSIPNLKRWEATLGRALDAGSW